MLSILRIRLGSLPVALGLCVAFLASQLLLRVLLGDIAMDALRLQTSLSVATFSEIVNGWQTYQMQAYLRHFYWDMIHPFIYATSLCSILAVVLNRAGKSQQWNSLFLIAYLAGFCDLVENFSHCLLLLPSYEPNAALIYLGNGCAIIKWALILGLLLFTTHLFIGSLLRHEKI